MNRILSITIAVIILIIAVEVGYYWGVKTAPQARQLIPQIIQTNKSSSLPSSSYQLTPEPTNNDDSQKIISQKSLEISKIAKNGNQIVESGDIKSAIQDLIKIAILKSDIDRLNYKMAYPDYFTALLSAPAINNIPDDGKLKTELNIELQKINFNAIIGIKNNDLAKFLYKLGLISYKNGYKELTLPLWISMVNLSPEWSHFQLELANYYLATENIQAAKDSIDYCENFNFPKEICDLFLLNEIRNKQPHSVGFMEDRIKTEVINK